jgi:energy-coupling factor transporter ATP-binding protein EcfA2
MRLTVENFRGIPTANIELSPKITLMTGKVGSGKTTLLMALQCLATSETTPLGWKKKDAHILVTEGTKAGKATLELAAGVRNELKWPTCKFTGEKLASPWAAGMRLASDIEPKDLGQIIGVLPTKEDFLKELEGCEHMNVPVDAVWSKITTSGWDAAHEQSTERGKNLKKEWEKLAGRDWLPKEALSWVPEAFTGEDHSVLHQSLTNAQKIYEHAIKAEAVGEHERAEMAVLAKEHESGTAQQALADINTRLQSVNIELQKAERTLGEIPKALNKQQAYKCWSCSALGVIHNGELIEAPDPTKAAADEAAVQQRLDEQKTRIQALREERDNTQMQWKEAKAHADKCEQAHRRLNTLGADPEPCISVTDAAAEVEAANLRIRAAEIKRECDDIANTVHVSVYLSDLLSPDGLRKTVLVSKLTEFNNLLASICTEAEWPKIEVDEFLDLRFGGRPFVALSRGQKFTVNACMQIALAKLDKSQMLILDDVDIMDADLVNGLLCVLENLGIPSALGRMMSNAELVPDLQSYSMGASYWIDAGTVRVVTDNAVAVPA